MNEHTFPISEQEAHKLDEIGIPGVPRDASMKLQENVRVADQWVRSNAPLAAGLALVVGFLVGRLLKS